MPEAPEIAFSNTSCLVATWRSIVIPVIGRQELTVEGVRRQARVIAEHGRIVGEGKLIEIALVDAQLAMPTAELRVALLRASPQRARYYACASVVFDGSGYRAAYVRSVFASRRLMTGVEFEQKIVPTIEESARFSYTHAIATGMSVAEPRDIAHAVSFVRAVAIDRGILTDPRRGPRPEMRRALSA